MSTKAEREAAKKKASARIKAALATLTKPERELLTGLIKDLASAIRATADDRVYSARDEAEKIGFESGKKEGHDEGHVDFIDGACGLEAEPGAESSIDRLTPRAEI
jgi:hypothetical protein